MRKLLILMLALGIVGSLAGCSNGGEVTQEAAKNFSKTPDGKDDGGIDAVNNNR